MKKKILLIAVVIFVSIGLLSVSKIVQNKYINEDVVSAEKQVTEKSSKDGETSQQQNENQGKQETMENPVKGDAEIAAKGATPQTKEEDKTKTVVDSKKNDSATETKSQITEKVVPAKDVTKEPTKAVEPKKEPNFTVKDDITGKLILSFYVNVENKSVADITFSALENNGIPYTSSGRGEVVYFTMINNLKARQTGPLSGWCYYVNGVKSSVSCGAYKLKAGDVVAWKYLEDGVNN